MKAIYVAAALLLCGFAFSPASAAPISGPAGLHAKSPIILAQSHRAYKHSDRHHYVPGHRYRKAPHGWHRFTRRPGDWRTRGCILVGPVWFCP